MLKYGIIGVWCAGVCLTAVYAGWQYKLTPEPVEPRFPLLTEHHSVASDMVTVPIVRNKEINGYVVAKVSLTANDEAYHDRTYPISVDLTDQLLSLLQAGMPVLTDPDFTVDLLRKELVDQMNTRLGRKVFYNALITQLDYLTPADIERLSDPVRSQMKVTPLVDQTLLDAVPR